MPAKNKLHIKAICEFQTIKGGLKWINCCFHLLNGNRPIPIL